MNSYKSISKSISSLLSPTSSYISKEETNYIFYGDIAKRAMEYEGIKRNPVILIPGFLGSALKNTTTNENIWGNFHLKDAVAITAKQMHQMAFPMAVNYPIPELKDDTVAEGILEQVNLSVAGVPIHFPAYKDLVDILIKGGFQPEHHPLQAGKSFNSLFLFGYDWRNDLPTTARQLHQFILEKRQYIQQIYEELYGIKDYDVQFDIIAHSMGGLVTRYYLQYGTQDLPADGSMPSLNWRGQDYLNKAIIVGTPNAGYLDTFLEMVHGDPLLPSYPTAILGTFPSYYQMLPDPSVKSIIYKNNKEAKQAVDVFSPELWQTYNWGLADAGQDKVLQKLLPTISTTQERRAVAIDHLTKCLKRAKQFIKAMSVHATPPAGIKLYLVCGNGIKTTCQATIDEASGKVSVVKFAPGDGKVLTTSAIWDERAGARADAHHLSSPIKWSNIMLLRAAHMGITKAHSFEDNLLFLLIAVE